MSRRVVLYHLMSLDGVGEEPGDWMFAGGPAIFENLGAIIERQDDVLLGRGTYDYWSGFWPTADMEPFASFINETTKHVFTSSPLDDAWPNSVAAAEPAAEYVAALKRGDGGDIGIHGSIGLSRSLLAVDLIDEIRLVVAPALAHTGARLFDGSDGGGLRRLELVESHATAEGAVLLAYRLAPGGSGSA
ncbi:deaminase [Thermoleophilia bacterium SCSIO 60948]|nr:deaminase [Thermoleophilia bacterium SCSIO 60948]